MMRFMGNEAKTCILLLQVAEVNEPNQPVTPQRMVASGALNGLGLAEDLLRWEFTPTELAPAEYRAVPYDAQHRSSGPGTNLFPPNDLCFLFGYACAVAHLALSVLGICNSAFEQAPCSLPEDRKKQQGDVGVACPAQAALAQWTRTRRRCSSTCSAWCSRRRRCARSLPGSARRQPA